MSGHALSCTLCTTSYVSRSDWNKHLIQGPHQIKACARLAKWTKDERESALIIMASGNLLYDKGHGSLLDGLLRWFKENVGRATAFVGDLVLSPNPDKLKMMAVVQFESRCVVTQIFAKMRVSSVVIEDQNLELKKLETLQNPEWIEFLEMFLGPDMYSPQTLDDPPLPPPQACSSISQVNEPLAPTSSHSTVTSLPSIFTQFREIIQSIEIPEEELNQVQAIIRQMKQVLEETLPSCEVGLFRNNFMGLRNNPLSDTYLILMFIIDGTSRYGYRKITKEMSLPLQQRFENSSILTLCPPILEDNELKQKLRSSSELGMDYRLTHPKSGIQLACTSPQAFIVEYQLSRLTSYYCQFDTRVKPLLSLLYFWIKLNDITLGIPHIVGRAVGMVLPDPIGLEWLLLFYLYYSQKLIPVPQEIRRRPHHKLTHVAWRGHDDVGFSFDPEFAQNWQKKPGIAPAPAKNSEEFTRSVLNLFWKFLAFYGSSLELPCVLETRKGEIWTRETLLYSKSPKKDVHNQMLEDLVMSSNGDRKVEAFVMTNPMTTKKGWKVSADKDKWMVKVRPAMKQAADKLEQFIEKMNSGKPTGLLKDALIVEEAQASI